MVCRKRLRSVVPIIGINDSSNQYSTIYGVDPSRINEAIALASAFSGALDPQTLQFDLNKATQIAQNENLWVIGEVDQTIISQTIQIDNMVNQIMQLLSQLLNASFPEGEITNQLTIAMTNVFTNLNLQESSDWIFWKKEDAYSTTYLYNILFAIESRGCISCIPMGFEISVDIEKEKVLFITIKDKHTYSVRLTAINAYGTACLP
ncbi:hypothetical protein [Thermoactinomyces sp. DSM 45892]|uniref:hypothetical protein n=1 Tax=Thermoactinomyces sp. DSM 45892 TaxID=1882753 RepID=UPI00089503BB|nr:hypothetical protein [Thermoactinomyces sp. DSM 45892]SDY52413.1 toxin [Thermoactinomyces sp. DSM 45892]